MKKILTFIFFVICLIPINVFAQRGCCSHHGGVAGCSSTGRQICSDGTLSPSCTCQPTYIYGCTNINSINYNSKANKDDGSCIPKKYGCLDQNATNYDSSANVSNDSCEYSSQLIESEIIEHKTTIKYGENKSNNNKEIIQEGKHGKKEKTYEIIKDSSNNIISKNLINEKIIEEPIDEIIVIDDNEEIMIENIVTDDKEETSIMSILWILSIPFVIVYNLKFKNNNLLLKKISNKSGIIKIILYICYFTFIIPVFIDIIIVLINIYKLYFTNK